MNNKHSATIALLAFLSLVPLTVSADSGFILGGSVGAATLDENFDGFGIDSDSTAFRLTAGWQFSDLFAFEGGYHSFGTFDETLDIGGLPSDVSVQADGFTLGATVGIPLGGNFSLFGRAGAFFWDGDAKVNEITLARPEEDNLYYGAGGDLMVSEQLSIVGDWTRYELDNIESDVISIGIRIRF